VKAFTPIAPEKWHWARSAHYSQAARVGDLILTCGVAPFDEHGHVVGVGDFEAQCRTAVANVAALLDAAGSAFDRIVRQHVYLKRRADLDLWRMLRAELYSRPYPVSILVVITEHAHPDMLIEISCEALVAERA
jgi:2-iminobutanoate/2-iminopropanoate deaminase